MWLVLRQWCAVVWVRVDVSLEKMMTKFIYRYGDCEYENHHGKKAVSRFDKNK
jgi:hypothetical protein